MANLSGLFVPLASLVLKTSLLWAAAWVVTLLLRRHSASLRHLVWTTAAIAVLALPLLTVSLPVLRVTTPARVANRARLLFQTTTTITENNAPSPGHASPSPAAPTTTRRPIDWLLAFLCLWVLGSTIALAQIPLALFAIWRVRSTAKPLQDRQLPDKLARELGLKKAVEIFESTDEIMPMTFGFPRPSIYLPCDAVEWTAERRRVVLLHELAHVRRGDVPTRMIARLALILHWWNPLAWIAWRTFLKESERAADDLVLGAGAVPSDYAGHLLDVARAMQITPARSVAVAMARPSELEARLLAILDPKLSRQAIRGASALAVALAAICIVLPLAAVRAQDPTASSAEIDSIIRSAVSQHDIQMLEQPAEAMIKPRKYDEARKLLDAAVEIRKLTSGERSIEYGIGLMKIADLEKQRNHGSEAESFYLRALELLGNRPETASALMFLGMQKQASEAFDYFKRAELIDPSVSAAATTWMAVLREREQNPAEAETLYRLALAASKASSMDALNVMELYGRFLAAQGREAEAAEMLERCKVLQQTLYVSKSTESSITTAVFRAGGGVKNPSPLYKLEPEYTPEARFAKFTGTVVCKVVIDTDGKAKEIRIIKAIGFGLDQNATDAIAQWKFKPGENDGAPVAVAANIEVNFKLL